MGFGIEINDVAGAGFVRVPSDHIEVQVGFHISHAGEGGGKGSGTQEALFLAIPEGEDDRALGLSTGGEEGSGNLQDGGDPGGVVVRTVVNLVARQENVMPEVVVMRPDDDNLVRVTPLDDTENIVQVQSLMHFLLQLADGIGMHLPASSGLLPLGMAGNERMVVGIAKGRYAQGFEDGDDVVPGHACPGTAGFPTEEFVLGKKLNVGFRREPVDGFDTFGGGSLPAGNRVDAQDKAK